MAPRSPQEARKARRRIKNHTEAQKGRVRPAAQPSATSANQAAAIRNHGQAKRKRRREGFPQLHNLFHSQAQATNRSRNHAQQQHPAATADHEARNRNHGQAASQAASQAATTASAAKRNPPGNRQAPRSAATKPSANPQQHNNTASTKHEAQATAKHEARLGRRNLRAQQASRINNQATASTKHEASKHQAAAGAAKVAKKQGWLQGPSQAGSRSRSPR